MMRLIMAIAAALSLGGCVQMTIDEETVFAPPERAHDTVAASQAEMQRRWLEIVDPALAEFVRVSPDDITGGVFVRFAIDRPSWTPVEYLLRDGFWPAPHGQIAYSRFSALHRAADGPLFVMCPGNAGDRYNSADMYANRGLQWGEAVVFDYPGYGDSTGEVSAAAFEAALPIVRAQVTALAGDRPLVFWGHSLGGFVCARMASQTPEAAALVLETTARDAASVAAAWTPWYAKPIVRANIAPSLAGYDVAADAARFGGPVLVIGAGEDSVLPTRLARALAADLERRGAPVTYVEFPDAWHWNAHTQPNFRSALSPFFASLSQD
ncbi:MAG: alpha/beta hydrolase family protein [Caulobacterales bacterium]